MNAHVGKMESSRTVRAAKLPGETKKHGPHGIEKAFSSKISIPGGIEIRSNRKNTEITENKKIEI